MANVRKRLGEHLLALKLITLTQLDAALEVQRDSPAPLGSILVSLGYLSEDMLLKALAAQMGVSPWRLDENPPAANAVEKLPGHLCRTYQVLPVLVKHDLLVVAMRNPLDLDAIDLVRNYVGMRIEPVLADADRLMRSIDEHHGPNAMHSKLDTLVDTAIKEFNLDVKRTVNSREKIGDEEQDTRPVVGLINQILSEAIRMGASDVHIEPRADRVDIRYRLDGQMQKVRDFPLALHPMLTTRLKIMAELDIVEFRVPQDGRITVSLDNRLIDMRVSILPNAYGQRIVLRILDKSSSIKKLEELGFTPHHLRSFRDKIQKPYGIYLVTGPTGSGKTTTLYAALAELKSVTTNIMTCEDPIEYDLDGINQSQVNDKVGLTFASQLRAILRQDPDIILVGEIRDSETASTAVRASLTGHLVLSTLHCNDAPSSVPRLLDMEVDPFLLSTCLLGVSAQRLLRTLCTDCKTPMQAQSSEMPYVAPYLPAGAIPKLWHPKGCQKCANSGYHGRQAVHEVMSVTSEVATAIAERQTMDVIRETATKYGYSPMSAEAIHRVLEGVTALEEARHVVFFESFEETNPFEHWQIAA